MQFPGLVYVISRVCTDKWLAAIWLDDSSLKAVYERQAIVWKCLIFVTIYLTRFTSTYLLQKSHFYGACLTLGWAMATHRTSQVCLSIYIHCLKLSNEWKRVERLGDCYGNFSFSTLVMLTTTLAIWCMSVLFTIYSVCTPGHIETMCNYIR